MDKKGLKLAFEEMRHDHCESKPLRLRKIGRSRASSVNVGASGEKQRMDKDGAKVLENEHGPPRDLRSYISLLDAFSAKQRVGRQHTEVLDENLAGGSYGCLVGDEGFAVLERLLARRVKKPYAVVITNSCRLSNLDLDIFDGGVRGELD